MLWLLSRAGFPLAANLPRTLLLLLLDTASFILPLFVLATLTRTFFRLFLTILGIFAAIFVIALASGGLSSTNIFTPGTDPVSLPLYVITCVTIVFIQYSSRTIWLARAILVISLLIVGTIAINPLEGRILESILYPLARPGQVPAELAISTDPSRTLSASTSEGKTSFSIPLTVASVPYGYQVTPEDARLTIQPTQPTQGPARSTTWQAIYNRTYTVNTRFSVITLELDKPTLALLHSGPVTLQLQLALAVYEHGQTTRIPIPATSEFPIPGLGLCSRDPDLSLHPGLTCRIPLRQPPLFLLAGTWTTQPCSAPNAGSVNSEDAATLTALPGSPNPTPIDVSLPGVIVSGVSFSLPASTDVNLTDLPPVRLCPGATLTATPLHLLRRTRLQLTLPNFRLP